MDYDICVVGAGPAGLAAAGEASSQGARVVVLDRKLQIGSPVRCAEVLGQESFTLMGLDTNSDFVCRRVNRVVMFSPKGKKLDLNIPYKEFTLYILDRYLFENELASRVVRNRGEILLGTTVENLLLDDKKIKGLVTSQGEITSKIIIGADGIESRIGRLCGLTKPLKLNEIFTCAQHTLVDMEEVDDHFKIYLGSKHSPFGYAWIFPKRKGTVNLGLGVMASTRQNPLKLLAKFKDVMAKGASSIRLVTGCVPSSLPPSRTVLDNVMLVGDAARQSNAFSGGGIANALIAGRKAGEIAGRVAVHNSHLSELVDYDTMWRREFLKVLEKKYKQKIFLKSDRKTEAMVRTLRFAAKLKPLIPKGLVQSWLSPNF